MLSEMEVTMVNSCIQVDHNSQSIACILLLCMFCPIAILADNISEVSLSIPQSTNINSLPIFPTMWFV